MKPALISVCEKNTAVFALALTLLAIPAIRGQSRPGHGHAEF